MKSQRKRIEQLEEETDSVPDVDLSVLSDSELDFYIETLEKAGYDWNKEGDLSLLTQQEIYRLESLTEKTQTA